MQFFMIYEKFLRCKVYKIIIHSGKMYYMEGISFFSTLFTTPRLTS